MGAGSPCRHQSSGRPEWLRCGRRPWLCAAAPASSAAGRQHNGPPAPAGGVSRPAGPGTAAPGQGGGHCQCYSVQGPAWLALGGRSAGQSGVSSGNAEGRAAPLRLNVSSSGALLGHIRGGAAALSVSDMPDACCLERHLFFYKFSPNG